MQKCIQFQINYINFEIVLALQWEIGSDNCSFATIANKTRLKISKKTNHLIYIKLFGNGTYICLPC